MDSGYRAPNTCEPVVAPLEHALPPEAEIPCRSRLNKSISLAIIFAVTFTIFSCNQKKDSVNIANDHNAAKFNNTDEEIISHFIVYASEILLQEIQLAKLAQKNSIRKDVQKAGKALESEYSQFYYLLKLAAEKKSISIPEKVGEKRKKIYMDASYEVADDFDLKYFDLIKQEHILAIDLFEQIKNETDDTDIKKWAMNVLPTFRRNLGEITVFNQKLVQEKENSLNNNINNK